MTSFSYTVSRGLDPWVIALPFLPKPKASLESLGHFTGLYQNLQYLKIGFGASVTASHPIAFSSQLQFQ